MKVHAVRINPDKDLKEEIAKISSENKIKNGCIVSAVGSLRFANLRLPVINGKVKYKKWDKELEIVSITGTISENGESMHVHISFSDITGNCFGGHLMEGCITKTTVELIILEFDDLVFKREVDSETGFKELIVKKASI